MPRRDPQQQFDRVSAIISASNLHDRAFGEKSRLDNARLSLAQQAQLMKQASDLEKATLQRAKFNLLYRKTISSAAANEAFSAIDANSPTAKKDFADVQAKYADGLDTHATQLLMQQKRNDILMVQKAEGERAAATFTGQANEAWNAAYKSSGNNVVFANKMGEAQQKLLDRAQKAVTDPTLDPTLLNKLYDVKTGRFNTDPALLSQSEVDIETKANKAKLGTSHAATLTALDGVIKTLSAIKPGDDDKSPEAEALRATRFNAISAMKDHSYQLMTAAAAETNPTAPAATANPADAAFAKYLGAPAAPAAAPSETPAPTVTPTPIITPPPAATPVTAPTAPLTPEPEVVQPEE